MGCNQKSFTLVWQWHQSLSRSLGLPKGHMSQVSLMLGRELSMLPSYFAPIYQGLIGDYVALPWLSLIPTVLLVLLVLSPNCFAFWYTRSYLPFLWMQLFHRISIPYKLLWLCLFHFSVDYWAFSLFFLPSFCWSLLEECTVFLVLFPICSIII